MSDRRDLLVAWLADRLGRDGRLMSTLPSNPNLDQLRHQARDLLRAARAGEREASERIRSVSGQVTLAGAQLAIARGYGFPSWPALRAEVEALTRTLAEAVEAFLIASVSGRIGRVGQLLAQHQWSPLRCAVASAGSGRGNEPIVRLLLERGAKVAD